MKIIIFVSFMILSLVTQVAVSAPYLSIPRKLPAQKKSLKNVVYRGIDNYEVTDTWRSTVQLAIGPSTQCTGSFIQQNVILTAAHCVFGQDTSFLEVRFYTGSSPAKSHRYSSLDYTIFINPNYDSSTPHDLALIVFNEPLFHSESVYQILVSRLFATQVPIAVGETIYISGTGRTEPNLKLANESLNFAAGTVTRRSFQGRALSIKMNGASGICGGDSGSPLTVNENGKFLLIGVASASSVDLGDCGTVLYATLITPNDLLWIQSLL